MEALRSIQMIDLRLLQWIQIAKPNEHMLVAVIFGVRMDGIWPRYFVFPCETKRRPFLRLSKNKTKIKEEKPLFQQPST